MKINHNFKSKILLKIDKTAKNLLAQYSYLIMRKVFLFLQVKITKYKFFFIFYIFNNYRTHSQSITKIKFNSKFKLIYRKIIN